jgi:hypothetical protein
MKHPILQYSMRFSDGNACGIVFFDVEVMSDFKIRCDRKEPVPRWLYFTDSVTFVTTYVEDLIGFTFTIAVS